MKTQELISRFHSELYEETTGQQTHAIMARGSMSELYEPNTGGNVWVCFAEYDCGFCVTTADGCRIFSKPHGIDDCEKFAGYLWDLCGEDEHLVIAECGWESRESELDADTAERIYKNVADAMQEAEEITGDMSVASYVALMRRIAKEATTRANTAARNR